MKTTIIAAILSLAAASASASLTGLGSQSAAIPPVGAIAGVFPTSAPASTSIAGISSIFPAAAPIAGPSVITPASAALSSTSDFSAFDKAAASGTAIALAMPVVTPRVDKPLGCGIGASGYSGRYAVAASCAKLWAGRSGTEMTGRVGAGAASGSVGVSGSMTWLF